MTRSKEALTASGMRVLRKDTEVIRRLIQPWQPVSFNFYDTVPEIKYAASFYSRMLAPLVLYAAEYVDDTQTEFKPTDNPEALMALERIQDPGGGRQTLLASYGRLMFLAGECYLFVSKDEDGIEQWEFLSTDELRIMGGTYLRFKAPSLLAEEYLAPTGDEDDAWEPVDDKEAVAYRIWQRHPRYSFLADSTMQGVLEVCEELVLLTKAVRARARNRASGPGLLFIDDRISPAPPEPAPDEDPEEDIFLSEMAEYLMAPIADEGSAAAAAPYLIRVPVPDDMGLKVEDMVHHLQLQDPMQLYPETGLRRECIERLAIGLDMPPEELLGVADVNHWSAWAIDEKTWKAHGQNKAQQLCNDLIQSYYRPYLREIMGDEASKYLIAYDATAIINHPDRAKDAKDLFDRGVIGKEALREAAGFDEEDSPSEEERAEYVGIKTHDSSLAWYGIPSVKTGGIEPGAGEIVSPTGEAGATGDSTGAEVEPGPPPQDEGDPPGAVIGGANGHVSPRLIGQLTGASDIALLRARQVAGARIRTRCKGKDELLAKINGARNDEVAALVGREGVRSLRIGERELIAGADDLILATLHSWGVHDLDVIKSVCESIEQHAVRTLYERTPRPMPETFGVYLATLIGAK